MQLNYKSYASLIFLPKKWFRVIELSFSGSLNIWHPSHATPFIGKFYNSTESYSSDKAHQEIKMFHYDGCYITGNLYYQDWLMKGSSEKYQVLLHYSVTHLHRCGTWKDFSHVTPRFWAAEQQGLFLIPHFWVTSAIAIDEVWLWQTKDLTITQNDLEAILKPWQSKLCFFSFFFFISSGCENTQINTLQHENSAVKFSFVTNSNKKAPSMPCHFQFRRKCTNKLLPLGHLWQWAILCQLLLKAIRISGPKISFKIIIFCIHVAGCQL